MDLAEGVRLSLKANLDRTNPRGIHIGRYSGVSFNAVILSHDFLNNRHVDTWIGERCQIGACTLIYPGVRIGNGVIVAAGSVVTRDVPDGCIVAGNPARIVEKGINPGKYGIRVDTLPPERLDQKMIVSEQVDA
jgi:acetyltransferase-like isoleucine patch superfamily enzyme